jgi:hypothetical protein
MIRPTAPRRFRHFGTPVKSHNPTGLIVNVAIFAIVIAFCFWIAWH